VLNKTACDRATSNHGSDHVAASEILELFF